MFNTFRSIAIFILLIAVSGCDKISDKQANTKPQPVSEEFKEYWYAGEAEITSYRLEQARYGEIREGTAVNIFVTEDFLIEDQVKTDDDKKKSTSVLKHNATKNFITGIYPYSIMQSTFYPVENHRHALKVTASIQEWCGQTFMQVNNRNGFEVKAFSYFEEEGDENFTIYYNYLENEIWPQLRVNPDKLPTGDINMFPSLEYFRLSHKKFKAYKAVAEFFQDEDLSVYQISYPELKRELRIYYEPFFPYRIEKWEESTESNGEKMLTTATKMEEIKSAYWNENSNKDLPLRDKLNLN